MSLAEEPYWTALIIAALFQSVLAWGRGETAHASVRNARGGGLTRHPSTNSAPAGGAGAGAKLDGKGRGAGPRPPVRTTGGGGGAPRGGAPEAAGAPHSLRPCRAAAQRTSSRRPTSPA